MLEPCGTIIIKQDKEQTRNLLSEFIRLIRVFETVVLYFTRGKQTSAAEVSQAQAAFENFNRSRLHPWTVRPPAASAMSQRYQTLPPPPAHPVELAVTSWNRWASTVREKLPQLFITQQDTGNYAGGVCSCVVTGYETRRSLMAVAPPRGRSKGRSYRNVFAQPVKIFFFFSG